MALAVKNQQRSSPKLYDPFDGFFRNNFLDLWNRDLISTIPSVNIRENKDDYSIEMAVPGMKKEDFDIDIDNNTITISCQKESETKDGSEENYSRREYNYSRFSRSFTVPQNAQLDQVKAKYADGMLQLSVPKKTNGQNTAGQKIKVE